MIALLKNCSLWVQTSGRMRISKRPYTCDLSKISRWKIGGSVGQLYRPCSPQNLVEIIKTLNQNAQRFVVIGSTSNILFADDGLAVPCIQIQTGFDRLTIDGTQVEAEAGIWVPGLARKLMGATLTGAEHICGIPGTLGGLIHMNGGSLRKSIGANVVHVTSVTPTGTLVKRTASDCGFAYRRSIFQTSDETIVSATFRFRQGNSKAKIRRSMIEIMQSRRQKFPKNEPNCGSVFVSDPAMYAQFGPPGAIIEQLGLKGLRIGDAMVSHQHANWINNLGQARSRDVLELVHTIKTKVFEATGFMLKAEARYLTPQGQFVPLDTAAQELSLWAGV